jgi:DNA polymerase-3 subunit gamma/tau
MSYQVLARKWRPQKFAELVGQEHVVSAISNALDNDKLHHAYLFTGTRGVGKTTIARIFSKSLNCETGQSANPCGVCNACKDIDEGRFVDLLEIDAASRTKVEDTRELLDNVQYKPTRGRFKVYLIDEVHMLSKHSFNALLKTLEEPPPHVKFLLATTDPQKLPITILSRCLQFSLKALTREQIQQQLTHILTEENIPGEASALSHLARAAQGSMRDALSLTDQAIAQGNNQVSSSVVTEMLGLLDKNQVLRLIKAIIEKDNNEAMAQLDEICVHAPDYAQVLSELLGLLHQISLTQIVPDICKIETVSARAIYQLSKSVTPEHIQLLYQIVLQGKKDLPYAPDAFTGLQMTVLRTLAFSPAQAVDIELEQAHKEALSEKKTTDLAQQVIEPEPTAETPSSEVGDQVSQSSDIAPVVSSINNDVQDDNPVNNNAVELDEVSSEPPSDLNPQQDPLSVNDSVSNTELTSKDQEVVAANEYQPVGDESVYDMSFTDDEAPQTMLSEFDEISNLAQSQRDSAHDLVPHIDDSNEGVLATDSVNTQAAAKGHLSTTADLLALHEQLENEEAEEEEVVSSGEEERGTSSLFDRLMEQDNSVFNGDADLPSQKSKQSEQLAEDKPFRDPLNSSSECVEPENAVESAPPWDDEATQGDESP